MMAQMQRPRVSVVVPIYRVERYLNQCVDSLIGQTLKDIQIILVDDGSPDGCGAIIDAYAAKDDRVLALHQPNRGYSAAVNRGMSQATGEYIGIIESDDWVEPDMFETLYADAKHNDTDITKGMFYVYNSTLPEGQRDEVFTNASGIDLRLAPEGAFRVDQWPKLLAFHPSIWSAIYRAEFVKQIPMPQSEGASYQDFPFIMEALCRAKRISVVKQCLVHWRNDPQQGNSTSSQGRKLLVMPRNTLAARKIVEASGMYDALKEAFYIHASWANYAFFNRIEKRYKREYFNGLRKVFLPIKSDPDFKYTYFSPIDREFVNTFLRNTWLRYRAREIYHRIRGK